MQSQVSLGWCAFCFYTLRTHKVIHFISKEAQLLIYNADNDAGHPLSGIIPSFCWEHCSSTKWLGIKKGDSPFSSFLPDSYSGKEKSILIFFFFPSSGRLNSEGVFTVDRFCISKCNQIYLRLLPQVNLLTEKYIPRDTALHTVPLLVQVGKVHQV